ncbi:MAG: GNAT family N-acetyltransferase [Candidatus Sulfotelmatobacter sp.]
MVRIRPATIHDAPLPCTMIREFAEFEHVLDLVTIREDDLARERFRACGIGTRLLAAAARIAVEERRYGIHWEVLNWNQEAIELYQALGAEFRDQRQPVLLADPSLRRPAEKAL